MLIQFTVKNFLSFKEEQRFSMIKTPLSELSDNAFSVQSGGKEWELLRSAVVYGANASGKSNLFLAMYMMRDFIHSSALPNFNPKHFLPFLFDDKTAIEPSEFEVIFIAEGVRYQYGFSATKERIVGEWLFAFPQGKQQLWFEREYNAAEDEYEWQLGDKLLGKKELWKKSTRPNALFLSTAVNLNSEQLKPIAEWWKNKIGKDTARLLIEKDIEKKDVMQYLHNADLGIADFEIKEKPVDVRDFPEEIRNVVALEDIKEIDITTMHETKTGKIELPFELESKGTHEMFAAAGVWLNSLKEGDIVSADELGAHLHPHLLRYLVGLFNNPKSNPNNAQLIFTTHDPTMLSADLFRRDQIWFCEKNKEQATELYSLAEFKDTRKDDNREAFYLSGRYGAVPFVGNES